MSTHTVVFLVVCGMFAYVAIGASVFRHFKQFRRTDDVGLEYFFGVLWILILPAAPLFYFFKFAADFVPLCRKFLSHVRAWRLRRSLGIPEARVVRERAERDR